MIKYFGDMATVELLLPAYLVKWLEVHSKKLKTTPEKLTKLILIAYYKRVTK